MKFIPKLMKFAQFILYVIIIDNFVGNNNRCY